MGVFYIRGTNPFQGGGGTQKHPKSVPWNSPFHPFLTYQTRDGTSRPVPSRPVPRTKCTLIGPNYSNRTLTCFVLSGRSEKANKNAVLLLHFTRVSFRFVSATVQRSLTLKICSLLLPFSRSIFTTEGWREYSPRMRAEYLLDLLMLVKREKIAEIFTEDGVECLLDLMMLIAGIFIERMGVECLLDLLMLVKREKIAEIFTNDGVECLLDLMMLVKRE
ncbi:hypothetical protein DVH24_024119 [Malus domestica]|uniref:Uncharacterized protein n=1 Tax=Malus domestica TaxID=3750 RepID=A0A498JHP9_MALDO|nr:hypothetical protein DVH24_024119 [Malus domestica]